MANKVKSIGLDMGNSTICVAGINEKEISVNLVDVKVCAEGYASIRTLSNYIDKDNTTLIIDIGMKTTDVLLMEWEVYNKQLWDNQYCTL